MRKRLIRIHNAMRQTAANVALIIMSTLLVLGVCEAGARLFAPSWLSFRMQMLGQEAAPAAASSDTDQSWPVVHKDGTFFRFEPSASFYVARAEYQHTVHIDEHGGRATRIDGNPGMVIPVLGDSFTFGLGVEDDETFVYHLAGTVDAVLLNLGVPGSTLSNQLSVVEMRHDELGRPATYLFVVFLGNDLTDLIHVARAEPSPERGGTLSGGLLWDINKWMHGVAALRGSYLIQLLKQRLLTWRNARSLQAADPVFQIAQKGSPVLDEGEPVLDAALRRLDRVARQLGFEPAFMLIPDRHQISPERRARMNEYYGLGPDDVDMLAVNALYRSSLERYGWDVYDATTCLGARDEPDRLYFLHDNHLTSDGHRAVAACAGPFAAGIAAYDDYGKMPISR